MTLGFKDFSVKKSNTGGGLYHIRYAGSPVFEAFEVSLGYKVKITCIGHKKTYPHFTFELYFSLSERKEGLLGSVLSDRKINIFDGNHDEFLNDEAYKRLTEIVRLWSLELNSKFLGDFDDEYSFTGNILIASSDQTIPIKDYISIISKFDFEKYTFDECNELCTSIKEVKIDELLLQNQREKAIKKFELMLEQEVSSEKVWQNFFECNKWMFGFGLDYIWVEGFQNKKLEQTTTGSDITRAGKRPDAFLKTQADISTTVFVELKTPLTQLVTNYRPDTWSPATELIGGVSPIQKTVASWLERNLGEFKVKDNNGDLTGEVVYSYKPKGILIIGKFDQFKNNHGINSTKLQCFELFRHSIDNIEIITFDEFFERVKRIVLKTEIIKS
jgi:Domain of unknown function (DUF4263)